MPMDDLKEIIEASIEELYLSGGPDIRLRVRTLLQEPLSKPQAVKNVDPVLKHWRWCQDD
jgi:hypothetical protein